MYFIFFTRSYIDFNVNYTGNPVQKISMPYQTEEEEDERRMIRRKITIDVSDREENSSIILLMTTVCTHVIKSYT